MKNLASDRGQRLGQETGMVNPWRKFPKSDPMVLPEDLAAVLAFNAKPALSDEFKIATSVVIPEPFVGAVTTAPVVVLQLNPGHDETNLASHKDRDFRAALFKNLKHAPSDCPFYFFDERFCSDLHPGVRWWKSKTHKLAEAVGGFGVLASRLAVIEWFPYKSTKFKRGCTVPSQEYGFWLVQNAIDRKALIVISRSRTLWERSVPELIEYNRILTLSSRQNAALTENNLKLNGEKTPKAWKQLTKAITVAS